MGFLKKFKEQKQDGPDVAPETGPVSTQPSIGPEDFLPPEPVPRTTRSRAKASSVTPAPAPDPASPTKGKAAARGKAKEPQQQQPAAETKALSAPPASPKAVKGKAVAQHAPAKAATGSTAAVDKVGEDAHHQLDASASAAPAAAAEETASTSKASGARSRAAPKVASSPRKETRGKGAMTPADTPKGGSSTESAPKMDLKATPLTAEPSIEQPVVSDTDVSTRIQVEHTTALSTQCEPAPQGRAIAAHTTAADSTVPQVTSPGAASGGQAAVLSEADLPRDPRKRHRAQAQENAPPSADRRDAGLASKPAVQPSPFSLGSPQSGSHPQPLSQPEAQPLPQQHSQQQPQSQPQLQAHQQSDAQPTSGDQGAAVQLDRSKQEPQTPTAQPEALMTAVPPPSRPVSGATGAAAGDASPAVQLELTTANQETDSTTLPPPPFSLPPPPPLPPHLASSRGQSHDAASEPPPAGRDDASTRSAYVMVGLREATAAVPQAELAGAGSDRDRNRDRDRHRHDVERNRERADRDRSERDRHRARHQPEAGGKVAGSRSGAEARASSPSRRDKDRSGARGDGKATNRSRSRSRERAAKPVADDDAGKDKDKQRDKDSGRSDKDRERERAKDKEREKERDKEKERNREKDKQREHDRERGRERGKDSKDKERGGEAGSARPAEVNAASAPRSGGNDRPGSGQHKGSSVREKASGRSRSRSRDAKRTRAEDTKPAADSTEAPAPAAAAAAASAAPRGHDSLAGRCEKDSSAAQPNEGGSTSGRDGLADARTPTGSGAGRRGGDGSGDVDVKASERVAPAGVAGEHHQACDEPQLVATAPASGPEGAGATAQDLVEGANAVSAPGSCRGKREPIVWNPPAPLPVPSPSGLKVPNDAATEGVDGGGEDLEQQEQAEPGLPPLSPSPRRTFSSPDSEPTRSRSRGYSSSDEEDDAGSIGKRDEQRAGAGGGDGEFDNTENEHDEVPLDEYDFDLMEADLMDEHLDEQVRTQDDAAAAAATVAGGGSAGQAAGGQDDAPVDAAAADGGKAEAKEPGGSSRGRNGATGRVAYEDMGAPGPDLSREQQVEHVTTGLVAEVGADMLAKLRKLLMDMSALDLSTVRPWALRSLLAINDDEARWRASQALLSIEWSTANNPGGVLHSRLQRAVEMERLSLLRSRIASHAKRARSASPGRVGPVAKRAERSGEAKPGRAASKEGRRSRSRDRDGGRSTKDRGRSREARDGGGSRPKSRDAEGRRREQERDRTRGSSKDRDAARDAHGRDRDRDARNPRDAGPPRLPLREPDVKSRRWEDVMRATMRGCIAKLPRPFVDGARRVLYNVDGLECSQIDANAWDPLLMLPNCEQRLNALRSLQNIHWKERFNVSATVKGTLLRCAEQVQRDMQRRDMLRPGMPIPPPGPLGLMPSAVGVGVGGVGAVGALVPRRDARYGLPIGTLPGPPSLLGIRGLPPPPPIAGASAPGLAASRYPPPPDTARLARIFDGTRDREDRSRQRSTAGAAGASRARSKSRSPSRGRRGAATRRSRSRSRSPAKGRSKVCSKSRSRSPVKTSRHANGSKSRSRSRARRGSSRSRSPSKDRRGTKRSRSSSRAPAEGGAAGPEVGAAEAAGSGAGGAALSSEFTDRMHKYLKSFGKLDLAGVDDKVFVCLGRLPDDGARMDCLRRLSGVQWHAVSGSQETQKRLQALLERGTNDLLKGYSRYAGSSKRRAGGGGGGSGRR